MTPIVKVTYAADCGKAFDKPQKALNHELVCKCWSNPKFKTCLTCKWSKVFKESGDEGFGIFPEYYYYRECENPKMKPEMFTAAHENAPDVCIGCKKWIKDTSKVKRKAVLKNRL